MLAYVSTLCGNCSTNFSLNFSYLGDELLIMSDPEEIIETYKRMTTECATMSNKIAELTMERDEHRLVIENLTKLEAGRRAFRLVF